MKHRDIQNKKIMIYDLLYHHVINKSDIEMISNLSFFEIEKLPNNYKNKILFSIYCNPYLLCNDYMFMDNGILFVDIHTIADILIKRYNMEYQELQHQLNEGYISSTQYQSASDKLFYLYFDSSIVGRRIYHLYNNDIASEYLKNNDKCVKMN